ncbi:MAG: potassium transporter KefB [Deltaproteobacteria bacterium]|nr:potassium transporter KefB [Deltaproteobacteria bacterium]
METAFLKDIIIISGLALGVVFVCHRLAIPEIVGFLLTGILAGPHGFGLVSQVSDVDSLAEIGVVCLLFTIGLEFSLKSLLRIKFISLVGGSLQVGFTVAIGCALASTLGMPLNKALFFGFLISLSSTAIVLKIMQERAEVESPHGRFVVGILLFQDVVVVPMMLIRPLLAGQGGGVIAALTWLVLKGVIVFVVVILAARWVVPMALHRVAAIGGREVFVLGIVFVVLSVAFLTAAVGLSLALGAFLAGLIVSESEYSHRVLGNVLPFRDLFTSFFFVSVGMLLDVRFVLDNSLVLALATLAALFIKFMIAGSSGLLVGLPFRTSVLGALALSQIGEFSFVLAKSGLGLELIDLNIYQLFLGISVLTMGLTPLLIGASDRLADMTVRLRMPEKLRSGLRPSAEETPVSMLQDHLIIVGFGLTGQNLARAATLASIPHAIIELNSKTVRRERAKGKTIVNGDAAHDAVLEHAGIRRCRVLVIVISDPGATRRVIDAARRLKPGLHIVARTRFVSEMGPLYELGADEVIPEEYEASVEVLTRVLTKYMVPRSDIEGFVAQFRAEHYRMLRALTFESQSMGDLMVEIPSMEIASLKVNPGSSLIGKSLAEQNLRKRHGVTVLAFKRDSQYRANPSGEERFQPNDVIIVLGNPEQIAKLGGRLQGEG